MENTEQTPKSLAKVKSSKWRDSIRKLYAGLEKIARAEEYKIDVETLESITNDFENFFKNGHKKSKQTVHSQDKFRLLFGNEILDGTFTDQHRAISLLDKREDSPINGDTLLLRAMSINVEKESEQEKTLGKIIQILVTKCPELIVFAKDNAGYKGITPVHLAILKEDIDILSTMARTLHGINEVRLSKEQIQGICAVGPVFQNTVMMSGTPLGVAALKFNKEVFAVVLQHFASGLDVTNDKGDNIVHSLIKYAYLQPDKLDAVLEMLTFVLHGKFFTTDRIFEEKNWEIRKQARQLLMMTNKEKLNPLQLAAKRQQFGIFEKIMRSEDYHSRESGDGLFNEEVYDITEIETLDLEEDAEENEEEHIKHEQHESVLEYLVHHQTNNAFLFAEFMPVKEVIREKWKSYKWWFNGWFVIHIIVMVLLSVAAVYRSKLTGPVSRNNTAEFAYVVTRNAFVTGVSIVGLLLGLSCLAMEISRILISRFQFQASSNAMKRLLRHFSAPYSNFIFRIYFILFSLLLITDCVIAAIDASGSLSGYENYCLIFAVIVGWYLMMFFLQTFKAFSMFTVLIQKAVIDMLKFALVMAFFLVAFSVAMYMIMQGADTEDDDFNEFSTTMLKMLTIMLGIGDLGILFQARHPYLAIFVFVLFVLLTTILLLNALIAMMSNSCTDLMNNYGGILASKLHCRLQKLSVILFLEGFFPRCICKEVGVKKGKYRYDNNKWVCNKQRRIWARSSVRDHGGTETEKSPDQLHLPHQTQAQSIVSSIMQQLNPKIKEINSKGNSISPEISTTTTFDQSLQQSLNTTRSLGITNISKCDVCQQSDVKAEETEVVVEESDK
ncbi:transient receptor potential cation channel subfamily V member 3-like [Mercenaria mercenaria]|uniref:transient receptor potential cation channel subfamily V member 3-like n=1 Tax=Mercenaria mercenaria TaxID=6596 RepID=UPI00234F6CEA|nr:transient receptor potential cation channel subfamily V member 3-like [Mercenaria mercenaria]